MREIEVRAEVCLPETEGGRRELARRLLEIRREAAAWQPEKERPPEKAGEEEA